MSYHVLDTDILTLFQAGEPAVVQRVRACPPDQLAITVITVEEQLTGWYTKVRRATKPDELARAYERLAIAVSILSRVHILRFPESAISRYEELRKSHRRLGKNDLRIAAIVIENDSTLVTRNVRDFQQIAELKIEDWSS